MLNIMHRYVLAAAAYGLARKVPSLWDGSVASPDYANGGAVILRPMLVGEKVMWGLTTMAFAPIMAVSWACKDAAVLECWARGDDARRFGYTPPVSKADYIFD